MKNYKMTKQIHVGANGGESLYLYDADGDGEKQLFFRQSPGMLDSVFYPTCCGVKVEQDNKDLFQITCLKQDGALIWRYGEPWKKDIPYNSHSGKGMTEFLDIDRDGKTELVNIRKDKLLILDALNGRIKKQADLTTDSFNILSVQNMGDGKYNIILKCDGKSEYGYGKPIMAYDSDLNFLWEQTDLKGGGHNIVMMDVDGDGKDEIFEGYNLLDHDGKIVWSLDFPSHSDQTVICDINDDGVQEVLYCTDNEDFVVANVKGEHLFTISDFPHPQKVSVGNFIKGLPGKQIFLNNRATHGGSAMLDCTGKILWEFPCNGYASTIKCAGEDGLDLILFMPGPGRCPDALQKELLDKAQKLGYRDLPITSEGKYEPFLLDGDGKIVFYFPHICDMIDVTRWGLPQMQKGDFGAGFSLFAEDFDGDGIKEFVIHTRTDVYVYHEV